MVFRRSGFDEDDVVALEMRLRRNLQLAQAMVTDFRSMLALVDRVAVEFARHPSVPEVDEAAEFLRWLLQDNFVFMSATLGGSALGFAHADVAPLWSGRNVEPPERMGDAPLLVRKGSFESPVHRPGRVDEIFVRTHSGELLFVRGMFTYRGVTQPARRPAPDDSSHGTRDRDQGEKGGFHVRCEE